MATQKAPSKKSATKKIAAKNAETTDHHQAHANIRLIALNQLELSPNNVRKVAPLDADDAELLASIKTLGIKQNLVVHEDTKGKFFVVAGGRRLKALQTLAEQGDLNKDYSVPCLVEDKETATLSSTTENAQRAAMHPADEFAAFAAMIDEGRTESEIATTFGVPESKVRRRLKLARVAPEIFEAYRLGEITLECVMAFTLTDHHDRQMTVWNAIKEQHHYNQHIIKRMLTETSYSASSKLGQFVGVEAYEKAGGAIMRDLFSERDTTYFENPELVERLALAKLTETAKAYEADWKWIDTHLDLEHGALRSFGSVEPQELSYDHPLLIELETVNAREEELAKIGDERDPTDEEAKEYETIEQRLRDIDDEIELAKPFSDEHRAIAGVVITIGWHGETQITRGLVRPEDMPGRDANDDTDDIGAGFNAPMSSTPAPVSDPAAAMRKAEGMPNSLADDLRTARHHILRAHLAADYDVAFDAMLYSMAKKALANCYVDVLPLDVSLTSYYAPNADKLLTGSVADRMLIALKEGLNLDWVDLEQPSDFKAMCLLSVEDKQNLFAWAAATALKGQLSSDNRPSAVVEELGSRMDVDVAACWRPTVANYWGSVTKAHIALIAGEIISDDFAEERSAEKKIDAAAAMEPAFAENALEAAGLEKAVALKTARWLPKGMEFAEANVVDEMIDDKTPAENSDPEDALPAFLAADTAA